MRALAHTVRRGVLPVRAARPDGGKPCRHQPGAARGRTARGAQSRWRPGRSRPGLQARALRAGDVVILALASAGPTQSIAVTLAALLAAVGYASFLPLLICFIPMLGIALGYQRLNAWQPSAGATYSWVGRALNPHAGSSPAGSC